MLHTKFQGHRSTGSEEEDFSKVLGRDYRGLIGGLLLLRSFSVAISVSPHVCSILVLIFEFCVSRIMH